MRRAAIITVAVLGFSFVSATPAEAQSFWRWLERLSGPGPFKDVLGIEFSPVCFGQRGNQKEEWRGLFCTEDLGRPEGSSKRTLKLSIVFDLAFGSGANKLGYAPDDIPRGVPDTGLILFSGGPMWRVVDAVDVGAAVGMLRLSALPVVGALTRPTLEPRISIRPLALGESDDTWTRFLELRYSPLIVFGGFSLADFGAVSGDLNGEPETIHSVQILINFGAFFR